MEMSNSTGLLTETIVKTLESMQGELPGILRDLLGKKASDEDIQLCEMSIRSQCMNPMVLGKRHKPPEGHIPPPGPPFPELKAEEIADHIVRFSLSGLREVRQHIESGRRKKGRHC